MSDVLIEYEVILGSLYLSIHPCDRLDIWKADYCGHVFGVVSYEDNLSEIKKRIARAIENLEHVLHVKCENTADEITNDIYEMLNSGERK